MGTGYPYRYAVRLDKYFRNEPMLVSTFELLVKPLVPAVFDILGAGRTVIQGYFLTIHNASANNAAVTLKFTAKSPDFNVSNVIAFFDILGANTLPALPGVATTQTLTFSNLNIGAGDTGLFILQPRVTTASLVTAATTEFRGAVDISLSAPFGSNSYELLLTPEHRGTFLPKGFTVPAPGIPVPANQDFDQLVYSLPTSTGKALFTLSQRPILIKPLIDNIEPKAVVSDLPKGVTPEGKNVVETPELPVQSGDVQRILALMAERIDDLSQRVVNGQAFIQPQERPVVGQQVINNQAGNLV